MQRHLAKRQQQTNGGAGNAPQPKPFPLRKCFTAQNPKHPQRSRHKPELIQQCQEQLHFLSPVQISHVFVQQRLLVRPAQGNT